MQTQQMLQNSEQIALERELNELLESTLRMESELSNAVHKKSARA